MNKFNKQDLLRNRINNNLLKVNDESSQVKTVLSLGLQTSKPTVDNFTAFKELDFVARRTEREDLLRICILLATSRNTVAQENLMDVISIKLGRIKDKDYKNIADLIYLKDSQTVDKVNEYLSNKLEGFSEMHRKYHKTYYAF